MLRVIGNTRQRAGVCLYSDRRLEIKKEDDGALDHECTLSSSLPHFKRISGRELKLLSYVSIIDARKALPRLRLENRSTLLSSFDDDLACFRVPTPAETEQRYAGANSHATQMRIMADTIWTVIVVSIKVPG
jgi:hypothetical protein